MNINNIKKLLYAYFIENWKRDLFYGFAIAAGLSFISVFMFGDGLLKIIMFFMIILMPTFRIYTNLYQSTSSRIHYLTIPASSNEKVVSGMILANFYYIIGYVLAVVIGLSLGVLILKTYSADAANLAITRIKTDFEITGEEILGLFFIISLMFFGSIYFRKNGFWKMLLALFLIVLGLGIIMAGTEFLNELAVAPKGFLKGGYYKSMHYSTTAGRNWSEYLILSLGIVYFYALSFLRMRETEA